MVISDVLEQKPKTLHDLHTDILLGYMCTQMFGFIIEHSNPIVKYTDRHYSYRTVSYIYIRNYLENQICAIK